MGGGWRLQQTPYEYCLSSIKTSDEPMSAITLQTTPKDNLTHYPFDIFQILEVSHWTQGLDLSDIGTFLVPLSPYVFFKSHIKWVSHTGSDKDAVHRL